jgi:hypothetical protein
MEKMDTTAASFWFIGGMAWFFLWLFIAVFAPFSSKQTVPESAQKFFTKPQYDILYPRAGQPKFDPQHPNPKFALSKQQTDLLEKWGYSDCINTDGTAAQDTSFFGGACFCENAPAVKAIFDVGGFAIQPSNTFSTFFLSIAGVIILGFLVFSDPPSFNNFMNVTYFFALCYAFMTIILGPFSMMLHLGLRRWGGWSDSLSLYVWFGFAACYALYRFIVACTGTSPDQVPEWTRYLFLGVWLLLIILAAALTTPGNGLPELWYCIYGGIALLCEGLLGLGNATGFARSPATSWIPAGADHWYSNLPLDTGGRTWFLAGGITFFLALTIWLLSFTRKPLCAPDSWFQGHAIFHTLSALAVVCLYKYYRHEGEA